MSKQTAVEWLKEVYEQQGRILPAQFEMAFEMEKEQIIDASENVLVNELGEFLTGEQYYNQMYGKENNK